MNYELSLPPFDVSPSAPPSTSSLCSKRLLGSSRKPGDIASAKLKTGKQSLVLLVTKVMDLNLRDHVVVVTGGGSGIGEATARAFAGEGAHVAIWDLDERAEKAAERIQRSFPVRSIGISADVVNEREVCTATKQTI